MPQKSAPELFAVVHYLHRLSTEANAVPKWHWKAAQVSFIMLEAC